MKIVMVEWVDSTAHYGWCNPEEVDLTPALIHSVGYLHKDDTDCVTLISGKGPENVDHPLTIPRGCIKKITPLRARGGESSKFTLDTAAYLRALPDRNTYTGGNL